MRRLGGYYSSSEIVLETGQLASLLLPSDVYQLTLVTLLGPMVSGLVPVVV
jgi:hypothetical protein